MKVKDRERKDLLVDFNTNGAFGNIPNTTSTSMVELVRHSLVNSTIHLDINIISDFENPQVGRKCDGTLLPEGARE